MTTDSSPTGKPVSQAASPTATSSAGAPAVTAQDIAVFVETIIALRFAAIQVRLYPEQLEPQQRAVSALLVLLNRILAVHRMCIIACSGRDVLLNNEVLPPHALQVAGRDLLHWMNIAQLRAIGFIPGVTDDEILRFLRALIAHEAQGTSRPLVDELTDVGLTSIAVVPKLFGLEAPLMVALIEQNPAFAVGLPELPAVETTATLDALPPTRARELLAMLHRLTDRPAPDAGTASLDFTRADAWTMLTEEIEQADAVERRSLLAVLAQWQRVLPRHAAVAPELLEQFEALLLRFLRREPDPGAMRNVAMMIERQLEPRMAASDWPGLHRFAGEMLARCAGESVSETRAVLSGVLERIGNWATTQAMQYPPDTPSERFDLMRPLLQLLGAHALRPMISRLKSSEIMQERIRLLRVLREFGDSHLELLIDELRAPNPWYVYRNILQVLTSVGTDDALGAISEKLRHEDARVRYAAVTAAAEIARLQAAPYLVPGLEDDNPDVRARAAALAALCPQPRIIQMVLQLLQRTKLEKDEPVIVQQGACAALGQFAAPEARDLLLQVLHTPLLSKYQKKPGEVRAVAATALANYLPDPAVRDALREAARERDPLVSQAARRALGPDTAE